MNSRVKSESRHKKEKRSKHRKDRSKKKVQENVEEMVIPPQEDIAIAKISRTPLQVCLVFNLSVHILQMHILT